MQTVTETINGREYSVSQLPARRGLKLFNRLCRIFAPPAARAFGGLAAGELSLGKIMGGGLDGLADALALLFEKLDENAQEAILRELFEGGGARYRTDDGRLQMLWEGFDV